MPRVNRALIVSTACLTVFLAQLGMMMYLPGLPFIAQTMKSAQNVVSLSLPLYLAGMAAPMLLWGQWAAAWGGKKLLITSLLIFSICSALLALSTLIETFLLLRFVQGVAASGMSVLARSIMAQSFTGNQLAKALSWLSMAFVISLGIGQYMGALLMNAAGWHATFWFLALAALFQAGWVFRCLPDLLQTPDTSASCRHYLSLARHTPFLARALTGGLGYGLLIAFNTAAPTIFQTAYQWSVNDYGMLGWVISMVYFLGAVSVNRWVVSCGQSQLSKVAIRIMLTASIVMTTAVMLAPAYALLLWFPYCLIVYGQAINYPVSLSAACEHSLVKGPYAMAMCGFIHQLLAVLIGVIVSLLGIQQPLYLALIIFLLAWALWKVNAATQHAVHDKECS